MTVKELIQRLQELPEDMDVMCFTETRKVKDLDVYFEVEDIMHSNYIRTAVVMKGEY